MAKNIGTLAEIGNDLCKSLGFKPTSNSTKPLYVANSLFRACTGKECKIDDIHDWILSERSAKAIPSAVLLEKYKEKNIIIFKSRAEADEYLGRSL